MFYLAISFLPHLVQIVLSRLQPVITGGIQSIIGVLKVGRLVAKILLLLVTKAITIILDELVTLETGMVHGRFVRFDFCTQTLCGWKFIKTLFRAYPITTIQNQGQLGEDFLMTAQTDQIRLGNSAFDPDRISIE